MRSETDARTIYLTTSLLLGVISVLGVVDLILDQPTSFLSTHVLVELALLGLTLGFMVFLITRWINTGRDLRASEQDAARAHAEAEEWKLKTRDLLRGLGRQIDEQLKLWNLTRAEREVALFLLKGFSHREISDILHKSERTTRQQASTIYDKSGLEGRAQLSAFFLEDLLLPADQDETSSSSEK